MDNRSKIKKQKEKTNEGNDKKTKQRGIRVHENMWNMGTWSRFFDWDYKEKQEACLIIKGEGLVRDKETNEISSFKEGDLVIFPTNWNCEWEIKKDIKKYLVFDHDFK